MINDLKTFFRFNKKIWIPCLILLLMLVFRSIVVPLMPALFQFAFVAIFQLVQVVVWIFLFFGLLAGRVRIKKFKPGDLDYTWADYRGNDLLVEKMQAFVKYLQGEPGFEEMGGEHEPGVLMEGVPGCGKTYLAKVLAAESGVPLWSVDCQSLLGCVTGDTIIVTENGLEEIGSIANETKNIDLLVESLYKKEKASVFYSPGYSNTLKIKFGHGMEITGTPDHPLVVKVRSKNPITKRLDQLKIGDKVLVPIGRNSWGNTKIDDDLAYTLGIVCAEGCYEKGQTNRITVAAQNPIIQNHLKKQGFSSHRNGTHWRKNDKRLINYCPDKPKAAEKYIPKEIMQGTRRTVINFLQGLYDGDGCATTKNRVVLATTSKKLATQVQQLLLNFGIVSAINLQHLKNPNHNDIYSVTTSGLWSLRFFEVIGFRIPEKQAWISKLKIVKRKPKKWKQRCSDVDITHKPHGWGLSRLYSTLAVPVTDIKDGGVHRVYDLTVPKTHTFIANGLLSGNTFMGIGPLKVSGMFKGMRNEAIKSGKGAILFLDEIDSIGQRRGGVMQPPTGSYKPFTYGWFMQMPMGMGGGMGGQILNTILSELDGLIEKITWSYRLRKNLAKWLAYPEDHWFYPKFERPRVMVICSTNRPDILDPALTRRGRIGYHVKIDLPTVEGLKDIANYYLDECKRYSGKVGMSHTDLLNAENIAKSAAGRTPADIRFILNSAVQTAHRDGRSEATLEDWMEALAEGTMGSRNPLPLSEKERNLLAIHESGHAIVLLAVGEGRLEPMFLTIERYGRALGHLYPVETMTWYLGATQTMLEAAACISLAGAVAEELIAEERHNSMGGDRPNVNRILNIMWLNGMLGRLPIDVPTPHIQVAGHQPPRMEGKEEAAAKRYALDQLYSRTRAIIEQNRHVFDILVPKLSEKKLLTGPEIIELVGEEIVPWEEK